LYAVAETFDDAVGPFFLPGGLKDSPPVMLGETSTFLMPAWTPEMIAARMAATCRPSWC
jgi:hypothetical protein